MALGGTVGLLVVYVGERRRLGRLSVQEQEAGGMGGEGFGATLAKGWVKYWYWYREWDME